MAEQARETPEEFGQRLAAELLESYGQSLAQRDAMVRYLDNRDAAQRLVQAIGGTAQDAQRMVFAVGSERLQPPRPRLILLEG